MRWRFFLMGWQNDAKSANVQPPSSISMRMVGAPIAEVRSHASASRGQRHPTPAVFICQGLASTAFLTAGFSAILMGYGK